MRVGDIVRNIRVIRTNPAVSGNPISAGALGIVIAIRPDTLNNPPLMNYVDVLLSTSEEDTFCGNYAQGTFEVINECR